MISFYDYIKDLPSKILLENFAPFARASGGIISDSRIKKIAEEFVQSDLPVQIYRDLSEQARLDLIQTFICRGGGFCPTSEDVQRELAKSFLCAPISTGEDSPGRMCGFAELVDVLLPEFGKTLQAVSGVSGPERALCGPWHELCDLAVILAGIDRELIQWTKTEVLTKSSRLYLKKVIHLWRSRWGNDNNDTVTLFAEFLCSVGALRKLEHQYHSTAEAAEFFAKNEPAALRRQLHEYVLDRFAGIDIAFFNRLFSQNDDWYSSKLFEGTKFFTILRLMEACGLILVCTSGGEILFRCATGIDPLNAHAPTVLADFSVIIAQEVSPAVLYATQSFAQLSTFDKIYKAEISQQVINDSLARDLSESHLLQMLGELRVPHNVLESVREWIRQFLRVSFFEGSGLIVSDEDVASSIENHPEIAELVEAVSVKRFFQFKREHAPLIRRKMLEMGFDLRGNTQERLQVDMGQMVQHLPASPKKPAINLEAFNPPAPNRSQGQKYSAELKKLDTSELLHVLEYAVLMNAKIRFSYRGSPYVKAGEYLIQPLNFSRGTQGTVEGRVVGSRSAARQFLIEEIDKIGVLAPGEEQK